MQMEGNLEGQETDYLVPLMTNVAPRSRIVPALPQDLCQLQHHLKAIGVPSPIYVSKPSVNTIIAHVSSSSDCEQIQHSRDFSASKSIAPEIWHPY